MNAGVAGSLVSRFIDKQWPADKRDVFDILKLAVNKAWQEGKWLGMTAEFFVPIEKDASGLSYIIAPQSHPILLACNTDNKHTTIRDNYFSFHKNGNGDVKNSPGCRWNPDVYDIGYIPTLIQKDLDYSKGVKIGVRSVGSVGPNEKVIISGNYKDGEKVYTYRKTDFGAPCGCKGREESVESINGISLDISEKFNYIDNINFASISSIYKTTTRSPIEVIAIDHNGNGFLIARIEPNQKFSAYRKYVVPNHLCNDKCIHGIFKISQQDDIISESDAIFIKNPEALICFCKGIYQIYYKEQPDIGAQYIFQGITILDKEKREEESPNQFPIQVDISTMGDLPYALKHFS